MSKNFLKKGTNHYLSPTTETAKRFKESNMLGNISQVYMALSPSLEAANETMKRNGANRMTRNCVIAQYSDCVNQPDMESDDFFFWTSEPASEQILHKYDISYPTDQLIDALNEVKDEQA